jgi:hypothetical protein
MTLRSNVAALTMALCSICSTSSPAPGPGSAASRVSEWGDTLALDKAVVEQIEKYSTEDDDLGGTYPAQLAANVRRRLFADAAVALSRLPKSPAEPVVTVDFLEEGFADRDGTEPPDDPQRDFERGFIRTESLAFIEAGGVSPEEALELFSSATFRMDVSSRIERIWSQNGLSCVEVAGVTAIVKPTLSCNRVDELIEPGLASQHSQVVANPGGDRYQTVYFKESLKTFVAMEGGLAYHYINYTRAVKLGRLKRAFGRGKIEDSEKEKIEELQRRIADGN